MTTTASTSLWQPASAVRSAQQAATASDPGYYYDRVSSTYPLLSTQQRSPPTPPDRRHIDLSFLPTQQPAPCVPPKSFHTATPVSRSWKQEDFRNQIQQLQLPRGANQQQTNFFSQEIAVCGSPTAVAAGGSPTAVAVGGSPTAVAAGGSPTAVTASGPPTAVAASGPPIAVAADCPPTAVPGNSSSQDRNSNYPSEKVSQLMQEEASTCTAVAAHWTGTSSSLLNDAGSYYGAQPTCDTFHLPPITIQVFYCRSYCNTT